MMFSRVDLGFTAKSLLSSLVAATALFAGAVLPARAQWTPTQPIKIIVPFLAGGGADIIARKVANKTTNLLGQPVIVDNRPGAGTAIGAIAVQNAAPDGYTLLLATSTTLAVNPILGKPLTYSPDSLVPVATLQLLPFMLDVSKDAPFKTLKDLQAYAAAHPGKLNYGTLGIGSSNHVLGGLLAQRVPGLVAIHYQGSSQAILALMRGDIHIYFDGISTSIHRVNSGNLRGLAVTSKTRVQSAPSIPTVAEVGLPELELNVWFGLVAPPNTPQPIVQKLNSVFNQVLAQPEIERFMAADGTQPLVMTPERFKALISEDRAAWKKAIDLLGIKLE